MNANFDRMFNEHLMDRRPDRIGPLVQKFKPAKIAKATYPIRYDKLHMSPEDLDRQKRVSEMVSKAVDAHNDLCRDVALMCGFDVWDPIYRRSFDIVMRDRDDRDGFTWAKIHDLLDRINDQYYQLTGES